MLSDVSALFDGATVTAPPADRRIGRRLVDVWARAARGRFPTWPALQEVDLGEDWDWVFAVDLEKSVGFPYFIYLGRKLAKLSDVYLTGDSDWTMTLLEKAASEVYAAVAAEGPHFSEDSVTLCDGRRLLFRAVTVPLANDGENISHVLGAANGRFAPQVELRAV